ncbi:5-hydroxytryptamine receptor 1D-like [Montipora foliosa]|uniref:5-hydroxytryptamine receptor 1D-like n=1 Tax=Montipora foliosa TaxID=591990 RepID=UPI0035F14146
MNSNLSSYNKDSYISSKCDFLLPVNGGMLNQSPFVRSVIISIVLVNILACPPTVVLNMLVMVAVKVKSRLRTNKSNILIATLASTDFAVGLFVQPVFIAKLITTLQEKSFERVCLLLIVTRVGLSALSTVSVLHLALLSGERFLALNRPFAYTNLITTTRLLFASLLTWSMSLILHIPLAFNEAVVIYTSNLVNGIAIILIIFCHVAVFCELRRHKQRITALQVTQEERARFAREKKAFKLTVIIVTVLVLCFLFFVVARIVLFQKPRKRSGEIAPIINDLSISITLLNSLLNPIIYSVSMKQFRISFVELLFRKVNRQDTRHQARQEPDERNP